MSPILSGKRVTFSFFGRNITWDGQHVKWVGSLRPREPPERSLRKMLCEYDGILAHLVLRNESKKSDEGWVLRVRAHMTVSYLCST